MRAPKQLLSLIAFCVVTILQLSSCSKDVEITIDEIDPLVVVDGWIESDGYAEIFLTQSFSVIGSFDSLSILKTFLNYGKVEIIEDTGESEILTLFKVDGYFPPFVYKSVRLKGKAGHNYQLVVHVNGKVVTAETYIPQPPQVSFYAIKINDDKMHISAHVMDQDEERNYYFYKTKRYNKENIYYPSLASAFSDYLSDGALLAIYLQKGISENFVSLLNDTGKVELKLKPDEFLLTDTVFIKFATINLTSYEILSTTFFDIRNTENPFQASGKKNYTNINGGLGHFTGLGLVKSIVYYNKYGASDPPIVVK